MPFEPSGYFGGVQAAEQGMAKMALDNTSAQQRSAQARWLNVRSAGAEQDVETERRVAAMMQNDPISSNEEAQNPGWKIADFFNKAGSPSKAMKAAEKASLIDQHIASANTNTARQSLIQTRIRLNQLDELGRAMHSVDSPEALQAQLQRHEQATGEQTGILDEDGNLPPQFAEKWESLRDGIQRESLSEKDRLATAHRARVLASADKERQSRQNNRSFWQNMENQERRAAATARGRGTKVGADVLSKAEGFKLGTDYISDQFVNLDPAQARVQGRRLTERAQQMRQKNPALTPLEAIQEAHKVMEGEGAFTGLRPRPYKATVDRPMPLPADGDTSKLKPGYFYSDGKVTREWLGNRWSGPRVKGKAPVGPLSMAPEDTSDAEDEAQNAEDDALAMDEEED